MPHQIYIFYFSFRNLCLKTKVLVRCQKTAGYDKKSDFNLTFYHSGVKGFMALIFCLVWWRKIVVFFRGISFIFTFG